VITPNRENLRDALIAVAIGSAVAVASKWPATVYAAPAPTPAPCDLADCGEELWGIPAMEHALSTPIGHAVLIALVVVTGLAWAVSEHGTPARKLFAVAFGGAVALGVNTLMLGLFGG